MSSERRRSLRGRFFLALLAIVVLVGAAGFAGYRIWDLNSGRPPATARSGGASRSPSPGATGPVTLAVTVTGASCQVFVRVPGGDILVNRSLARGQSVRFDERTLSVVLGDGGAAQVYVNGQLRPPGKAGQRVEFNAVKS